MILLRFSNPLEKIANWIDFFVFGLYFAKTPYNIELKSDVRIAQ